MKRVALLAVFGAVFVAAQITSNPCLTQLGLPECCVGSYPNITLCVADNWYLGNLTDKCIPSNLTDGVVSGQQVYIKDELNFCINLPNPDSLYLQQKYYSVGLYPSIVDAEGYVQSYCMGSYLPPGSLAMPQFGIRSAHVLKNFTVTGQNYFQIHGTMDCDLLKINCTASYPGAYDDGGQYDNGPFVSCGKEPYSGVDSTTSGNSGFDGYVEMAGDSEFCMRVCEPGNREVGRPCDVTQDTAGCYKFMNVTFYDLSWSYTDASSPGNVTTVSVSLPPLPSPTAVAGTAVVTGTGSTGKSGSAAVECGLVALLGSLLFVL
ncbi:hypothetical protein HK100_006881 [Physocladia obscura]|uniref:Uncharacterized protein n=1 Tax=Physocladia obscura TaxID=109957 RepID=A0AAD5SQX4_9FUNG|nr:hypothetical protein HK100_006881 [Physocladia obscura]